MRIIIDGYNLMHAVGFAGDLSVPGNLERARRSMLDKLTHYIPETERRSMLVVFDLGRRSRSKPQQYNFNGIEVVFSTGFDDADSMIESLIQKHHVPQKLLIVSSDHRIQGAARRRKARFIDSELWIEQLENPQRPSRPVRPRSVKPTQIEDTEYWLERFGIQELEQDLSPPSIDASEPIPEITDHAVEPEKGDDESYNPFPDGYGDELLDDQD